MMEALPAEVVFQQISFNPAKHQKRTTVLQFTAIKQARTICCKEGLEGKAFADFAFNNHSTLSLSKQMNLCSSSLVFLTTKQSTLGFLFTSVITPS